MKTSPNGRKFITKEEGIYLYAYDDAKGPSSNRVNVGDSVKGTLTIGVGHTTAAGAPTVTPGMTITAAEADAILAKDLEKVENEVNKLVKVPLTQNQFDALVSFQFNTGGLGRSQILRSLNAKDYDGAANAFMNWTKANGNPTLLAGRRKREIALFKSTSSGATSVGAAAGSAVVVAGTGAATAPTNYIPWIIAGAFLVGLIVLVTLEWKNWKESRTNVVTK